ncbi:hypothetical protein PR003_g28132, partial [Phytophthora rubi]
KCLLELLGSMAKRGRFEENEEDEAKVVKIQEMKV